MKYWFVRVTRVRNELPESPILFKFEDIQKALNFMWTLRETLFTEHVIISLLSEEDI